MSDVVRDLVVSLSLDAGEFARNMRAINASIKEAESTFKLAGAGVDRFGSSLGGQMARAETLMRTQTLQSAAVRQYAAHLGEANAKMSATQGYLATYSARLEEARGRLTSMNAAIESQNARVASAQAVFSREDAALQSHLSSITSLTQGITRLEQEIAACEMQYEHNLNTLGAADDETERYRVRLDALNASLSREKNTLASLQANTRALTYARSIASEALKQETERSKQLTQQKAALEAEIKKLEGQVKEETQALENNRTAVVRAQTELNNAKAKLRETEAEIKSLQKQIALMVPPAPGVPPLPSRSPAFPISRCDAAEQRWHAVYVRAHKGGTAGSEAAR